jgi:hypothetical protein
VFDCGGQKLTNSKRVERVSITLIKKIKKRQQKSKRWREIIDTGDTKD